jgi:hypothetical protein
VLSAAELAFDPVPHLYALDGRPIPSVTSVIDFLNGYMGVPEHILAPARERGQVVHEVTALYDRDDLVMDSVDPIVLPYLNAWIRFLNDTGFVPDLIEQPVFSRRHWYAGTLDRTGHFPRINIKALLDIKSAAQLVPTVGPQTAAYKNAVLEMGDPSAALMKRYALYLWPDRNPPYRLEPCNDSSDMQTFASALNLHNWKKQYGTAR